MHIDTTLKQHTDNMLSVNDTVKFVLIAQIAMYRYDMYVKVAYDNFDNKQRYDDDDDDDDSTLSSGSTLKLCLSQLPRPVLWSVY